MCACAVHWLGSVNRVIRYRLTEDIKRDASAAAEAKRASVANRKSVAGADNASSGSADASAANRRSTVTRRRASTGHTETLQALYTLSSAAVTITRLRAVDAKSHLLLSENEYGVSSPAMAESFCKKYEVRCTAARFCVDVVTAAVFVLSLLDTLRCEVLFGRFAFVSGDFAERPRNRFFPAVRRSSSPIRPP